METLTCPKCHGPMRTYERSGVTVDQCTECRGIFLDRGELERLVDAETSFNSQPEYSQPRSDDSRSRQQYEQPHYDDSRSRQQYPPHRKKRKSFMEELFD
jgi:uncharacterized protein